MSTATAKPIPVCPEAFDMANFNGSTCDLLKQLLLTNSRLNQFFGWLINPTPPTSENNDAALCKISINFAAQIIELLTPIGSGFWSPTLIPGIDQDIWILADGTPKEKAKYPVLYNMYKDTFGAETSDRFAIPNMQGRFMLCVGKRVPDAPPDGTTETEVAPNYSISKSGGHDSFVPASFLRNHKHGYGVSRQGLNADPGPLGDDKVDPNEDWLGGEKHVVDAVFLRSEPLFQDMKPYRGYALDLHGGTNNKLWYEKITNTDYITTETISNTQIRPAEDENMPPYLVGAYYIRGNHKLNGVILTQ